MQSIRKCLQPFTEVALCSCAVCTFLGKRKNNAQMFILSSSCKGCSFTLLTSKIQMLQTIQINIFLSNSSRVSIIVVFDCSMQTNILYPTISQEISCWGFFPLVNQLEMQGSFAMYFQHFCMYFVCSKQNTNVNEFNVRIQQSQFFPLWKGKQGKYRQLLQVCHWLTSNFSIYPVLPELTNHFCQESWKQKQCNLSLFLFKFQHLSKESLASFCFHWNDLIFMSCRNSRAAAVQGSSKAPTRNSSCCQVAGDK